MVWRLGADEGRIETRTLITLASLVVYVPQLMPIINILFDQWATWKMPKLVMSVSSMAIACAENINNLPAFFNNKC